MHKLIAFLSVFFILNNGDARGISKLSKKSQTTTEKEIARAEIETSLEIEAVTEEAIESSCVCGAFLSGQFNLKKKQPPKGNPAIMYEADDSINCDQTQRCVTSCVNKLVDYMPSSPQIICGSIDRDCYKETVTLFVNVCNKGWKNSKMTAGKEFCCKDGIHYNCPKR